MSGLVFAVLLACPAFAGVLDRMDEDRPRPRYVEVDLGLTEPRLVREDIPLAALAYGPQLGERRRPAKSATWSGKLLGFRLELADAFNFNEPSMGDFKYYRFHLIDGAIVDSAAFVQAVSKGVVFCELVFSQPRSLWGKEEAIEVPSRDLALLQSSGSGCSFCMHDETWELSRFHYWEQRIAIHPYSYWPRDRSDLAYVSCAKPTSNSELAGKPLTVEEINKHLSLMRQPILVFYSDYPGFQAR